MEDLKFKENEYVNLYNPASRDFFAVRILIRQANGYKVKVLQTEQEKDFQDFYFDTYGYHRICISDEMLQNLGFLKNNLQYKLDDFIVWECLHIESEEIKIVFNFPFSDLENLGYVFLNEKSLEQFTEDFKDIQEKKNSENFKEKYNPTFMANDLFEELIKTNPKKYNYEEFDKLFKQ